MAALSLTASKARAATILTAVAAATAAPSNGTGWGTPGYTGTYGYLTDDYSRVRFFFEYTAQVSAVAGTIWVRNRLTGNWSTWSTIAPALAPGGASPVNESRDAVIGQKQEFFLQLTTVTVTGGTVTVTAQGLIVEPRYD